MTQKTFDLLDALNRAGLDNSQTGFAQDIDSTAYYFGADENIAVKHQFVYIYVKEDELESLPFLESFTPDIVLHWSNKHPVIPCEEELIFIYYLD